MFRTLYVILVILYALIFASFFFKKNLSYRIVGIKSEIVNGNRDLTLEEYEKVKKASKVNHYIYMVVLSFSFIMAIVSSAFLYFDLFVPSIIPKIILAISSFWFIVLVILNAIHFIPSSPIW